MLRFLIGRMLVGDGISSFIAFGGVLAAGLFGWTTTQLGLYAIALSVMAGIGTFIGGRVDQKLGSKATVLIAAGVVLFGAFGVGLVGRDSLAFVFKVAPPVAGGGLFASLPERVFLGFSLFVGLTFGPAQASSAGLDGPAGPGRRERAVVRTLRPVGQGHRLHGAAGHRGRHPAGSATSASRSPSRPCSWPPARSSWPVCPASAPDAA